MFLFRQERRSAFRLWGGLDDVRLFTRCDRDRRPDDLPHPRAAHAGTFLSRAIIILGQLFAADIVLASVLVCLLKLSLRPKTNSEGLML